MIGSALKSPIHGRQAAPDAARRLVVQGLSLASDQQFGTDLADIGFSVAGGEILGIGGIAGNGQNELMAALTGEVLANRPGAVAIDGRPVGDLGPGPRRDLGATFVPEERNGHGAVRDMTLSENGFLSGYRRKHLLSHGLIDGDRTQSFAQDVIRG